MLRDVCLDLTKVSCMVLKMSRPWLESHSRGRGFDSHRLHQLVRGRGEPRPLFCSALTSFAGYENRDGILSASHFYRAGRNG